MHSGIRRKSLILITIVPVSEMKVGESLSKFESSCKSNPAQKLPPIPYKTATNDVFSFSNFVIASFKHFAV